MKKLKTLISVMLCAMLVLSLVVPSMAYDNDAKITINNAFKGETYKVYEMLYVENYKIEGNNAQYSYKATSEWETFVNSAAIKDVYLTIDDDGYVQWKDGAKEEDFAKLAEKAAESITATQTKTEVTSTTVEFSGLAYGYYLVTSSAGTLAFLDTTPDADKNVEITEKHTKPTVDKKVEEDSSKTYGTESTQQIGDTVNFKTTITAHKGAEDYKLWDEMTAGLTLDINSIKVYIGEDITAENKLLDKSNYTLTTNVTGNDKFDILFDNEYMATLTETTKFTVVYSAVLNENAVIKGEAQNGNINKTKLTYGDNGDTDWVETTTWALKFDVIKTDSDNKVIETAKFELYADANKTTKIPVVKVSDGVYRVAVDGEAPVEIEAGKATVKGLDANTTYYLFETEAPVGYNKVTGDTPVAITADNNCTTNTTLKVGDTYDKATGGVQIINNSGTELPSTGGTGKTILFTVGGIMMVVAFVLFTSKRRMAAED